MLKLRQQAGAVALLAVACAGVVSGQDILVTELMAVRTLAVDDDYGDPSDFIELYNAGTSSVDLGGFFLSDDCAAPFKWTFPAGVVLDPGAFLVVWASEKDGRDPSSDLHTNFRLDENGECVVLSDSFGEQMHIYGPYPPQELDYSYGLAMADGLDRTVRHYFPEPTPGAPNVAGAPDVTPPPVFSDPSGAYPPGLLIDLSMEVAVAGTEIRTTVNESVPTETASLYVGPIAVNNEVVIAARAFQPGLLPSRPVFRYYVILGADVLDFNSTIPVVVVSTLGRRIRPSPGGCGNGLYTPGRFLLYTPGDDGRAWLTDDAHFEHIAAYRRRGNPNYSCGREKFFFNMEFRDREGKEDEEQIFDFASHTDFAMWGPFEVDGTFMRNPIAFWMSREVGQWAPRTEFVECFLRSPGQGELTMNDYWGVYVLMERNKRGVGRIDVERLHRDANEEPEVTGGYILQRDRIKSGDVGTAVGPYTNIVIEYPKAPTSAQRRYITDYLNAAVDSLNPEIASQEDNDFVDVISMLDHHILSWYMKNVDALRLSTYMHKPRNGLLVFGPLWDMDRSMGSTDPRSVSPEGFHNDPVWDSGSRYFEGPGPRGDGVHLGSWYGRLFDNQTPVGDDPWAQAYRERWRELRQGPLRTVNIHARLDLWAVKLREPAERNFARWPDIGALYSGHWVEVSKLKDWLSKRAGWIDSAFLPRPVFDPPPGPVDLGVQVSMSVEGGQVYYTLNGPDPLGPTQSLVPEATLYTGPVTITENTRIRARARINNRWSLLREGLFLPDAVTLAVTEVMYNPPSLPGDQFGSFMYEFLEFQNVGSKTIDLRGVVLDRPHFEFEDGAVTTLGPGEHVVVARNVPAFTERYAGEDVQVAGKYFGSLRDTKQLIQIEGRAGELVMDFEYDGDWYPTTNGQGYSLVIRSPTAGMALWNHRTSWRPSLDVGGSPGREDSDIVSGRRVQGDVNGSGSLEISDAILVVLHLFGGREQPCSTAEGTTALMDVDGDDVLTQNDALRLLLYLFLDGAPPDRGLECAPIVGCPAGCG